MINRRRKPYFLPVLSRGYNAIERMFCRLEDLCPIATRYDRLAVNFLAAVCLAATVSYWLRSRILTKEPVPSSSTAAKNALYASQSYDLGLSYILDPLS